jgi:hypothetical protein
MMTDHQDEIALPRFEDRLGRVLQEAHDEHNRRHRAASRPAEARPAERPHGRRSLLAGIGALAAAAALVAGVASGQFGSDGSPASDARRGTDTAAGDGGLATRIVTAVEEATAESVVHVLQDNATSPDSESWHDETTGLWRDRSLGTDGAPDYDYGAPIPPSPDQPAPGGDEEVAIRTVDHCLREYADGTEPAPPARDQAQWIRESLAGGRLVEDGTETVDGRELIRLRAVPPEDDGFDYTGPAEDTVVLVDPDTYRPISLRSYPDSDFEYVQTFDYLPRTAQNLALLSPPVPDGFTQVDSLPGDAERRAAGCE